MEPRTAIKIGWATDGGGSDIKFFKKIFQHWTTSLLTKETIQHCVNERKNEKKNARPKVLLKGVTCTVNSYGTVPGKKQHWLTVQDLKIDFAQVLSRGSMLK